MSAIYGAFARGEHPHLERQTDAVGAALVGLGPDGGGSWSGRVGRSAVAVGCRLRRRVAEDAPDGQPVHDADAGLIVIGDVVLTNRPELCAALRRPNRPDVADTRLILGAYRAWGRDCPARLEGHFAFAVVDCAQGGLLLVRDQLGQRPLVVHRRDGFTAFASTALALCALDGVGELDARRATEWLAFIMASDATFVRDVEHLPAAHAAWIDDSGVRTWRYWDPDPQELDDAPPTSHAEALRARLDDTVARARRPGAPGVMVSGGLDSTSVAATVARQLAPATVPTYTSVPPRGWEGVTGPNFDPDERELVIDLAAHHPNLRPTFLETRGLSVFDGYDELFALGAPPPRNPCNALWIHAIYQDAAADGVRTLLTGAHGNLHFSADDPHWLLALLQRGRVMRARREARAWADATGRTVRHVLRESVLREVAPPWLLRRRRTQRGEPDPMAFHLLSAALPDGAAATLDLTGAFPTLDEHRRFDQRQAIATMTRQPGSAGQAEFLAALDARWQLHTADPTWDVRMIELCATQPPWVRRHDGISRAVCREAMADRLPDSIRWRTRRGAQLPDWFDRLTDAHAELRHELDAARDSPACRDLLDLDRVTALFERWPEPVRPGERPLAVDRVVKRDYRSTVLRALLLARYVRWFERERVHLHARSR